MKKYIMFAMLLFAGIAGLQAQTIPQESMWYNGFEEYVATVRGDKVYLVGGTPHEGGCELTLVPIKEKVVREDALTLNVVKSYTVVERPDVTAEHVVQDNVDAIVLIDEAGMITEVLNRTELPVSENMELDMHDVFSGTYSTMQVGFLGHGEEYVIDHGRCKMGADKPFAKYEYALEYDIPIGVISVGDKLWMIAPTVLGLNIYPATYDDDAELYSRTGEATPVYWSDHAKGRFCIASKRALNMMMLRSYNKTALRLMRNEILARHGYVFSNEELSTYFLKQDWYKPAASNDDIRLSAIEEFKIKMILSAEATPDDEWSTQMEE